MSGVRLNRVPAKITDSAREDIRNKVVPLLGVNDTEYERMRDEVCRVHSLTPAQVGTIAIRMKRQSAE